jgi:hypothetical protein
MRRFASGSLIAANLLLAGCGYVGDPLPPALNIPLQITNLSAMQRGDKIFVAFTIPAETTEGLPITSVEAVDLRAGPIESLPFNMEAWAGSARKLSSEAVKPGGASVEEAAAPWLNKEVVFGVRLINRKGRASEWSNLFVLPVVAPLAVPANLKAESTPEGVRLSWTTEGAVTYRIFRGKELLGKSDKNEYLDKDTQYGKEYIYAVQAARTIGAIEAESEVSAPAAITPRDTFPPATPTGASAIAGTASIELNWDRNTESDFKNYRIFRAAGSGNFEKIGGDFEAPAYSDRAIVSGTAYRYVVTAVDQAGNESPRSNVVEITAP